MTGPEAYNLWPIGQIQPAPTPPFLSVKFYSTQAHSFACILSMAALISGAETSGWGRHCVCVDLKARNMCYLALDRK